MNLNHLYSLLFLLILASCGSADPAKETGKETVGVTLTDAQLKAGGVSTDMPTTKVMSHRIPANGSLELPPQQRISVSSPIGGYVKTTRLLEGMHVHRGEALVELEHPDFVRLQERYWETLERKRLAESEFLRQQALQAGDAGALKQLQQAETEFNALSIQSASLSAQLQQLGLNPSALTKNQIRSTYTLYAAQDGFVSKVNMHIGKFVGPQEVMVELFNPDHLHAELQVAEKDAYLLKEKQGIRFRFGLERPQWHLAEVHLIGKSLTDQRTVLVHGHLLDARPEFIPGMYLQAEIEIGIDTLLSVPEASVVRFGGTDAVLVELSPRHFKPVAVKVIAREDGFAGIRPIAEQEFVGKKVVFTGAAAVIGALTNRDEE